MQEGTEQRGGLANPGLIKHTPLTPASDVLESLASEATLDPGLQKHLGSRNFHIENR